MGQQQSVLENVRPYDHCHPSSTLESDSKYFVSSQPVSKRSSSNKRNSAYSPLEKKSFNLSIPKPPPNLNKELPKIQRQDQKPSSHFRSRIRSLRSHVLTEETNNLRNTTYLMRRSDFSSYLDADKKKFDCNTSNSPSKDYRKKKLRAQNTSSTTENDFFNQNGTYSISVDEKPHEITPVIHKPHVMRKPLKSDSEIRNSTTVYRNPFLRHNIPSKLMLKSRAEARKSSPTSCRQRRESLLNHAKKGQNEIFKKTNNYQYNVKDSFQQQRTVTPNDLDYRHIGAFKLGTLRITNGVASPAPSIEQGMKLEKRPQSRDKSTLQDLNQYNISLPIQGPRVRPWTIGWSSLLRNNRDFDLATPEIPSSSLISDNEDSSSYCSNILEERMIPLKSDLEHMQNFDDPSTHSMISPYSLVELVEPSPPLQRTKMKLLVRDSLFDEEPWTPSVIYHPSPNLQDQTPQILGEDREYLTLTKPLAKADSGYRSNISVRSKKINSEDIPDGDEEFRTSRSNSGTFSFVPSINLKEDQSKLKIDEFLVHSENVQLSNSIEDENPLQKDCKSDMSEDESTLIPKENETISNTPISYTTQPSSIEPASTPSLSNSPTHSVNNTTPNSSTYRLSPQLIPSPLFFENRKESPELLSRRCSQNLSSIEERYQIKKQRDSYSVSLASKALLLQTSNLGPHNNNETIKDPSSLIENFQNLDKAIKYNSLAPLELPIEIMKGNSQSISSRTINHEDIEPVIQIKEVRSIENRALKESNKTVTQNFIKSSPSANGTSKYRLTFTHENEKEQPLEVSSLRYVDLPLLLDSNENSSDDIGNENIHLSNSHVKSSMFQDLKESNNSNQFSPSQNQNPTPLIPRRSDLRASRKNSFAFSEESESQHKFTPNLRDVSTVIGDKVCFSTEILENDNTLSTTSQQSEDPKQSKSHHVAYRLGKYKQIGPRPVIVPTIVANFQAIEQNTQKNNTSTKPSGNISEKSTASRNDVSYRKNKSIENVKTCLPLGFVMGSDKSKVENISGPENTKDSQSTWLLRQKKSSQSSSTKIQFPIIAKDEFESKESLESDNSPKLIENNRPKRYRSSSSALTIEIPRDVSVPQTRKSFEVHALEKKSNHSDTSRLHCLKEGVSRFITSIPGSMTSSNEPNTKSELPKEKRQKLQRQDWTLRSSNTYSRSQSTEILDRYMNRNLDGNAFSNMSHNSRSNSIKGSCTTSRNNEPGVNLVQKKTLSPPCRNRRSHPPQAHVTRRSYTMFNQEPPKPNVTNFYTYIENSKKKNLGMQEFRSTSQPPPVVREKMPHQKRKASLSEKFERKIGSTGCALSKRLDNKTTVHEENPQKISIASEKNSYSSLPHRNSQDCKSDSLSRYFINCGKSIHEEFDTVCKKQEQPDKQNEEILIDKWQNDKFSRIEKIKSQIDQLQNDSVLNRGRPISRAAETALLSKRSDAHVAIKLNSLKNHINQEKSNNSNSITLDTDKGEILDEVQAPSYSDQKKEPLANTTPINLNVSKGAPDKRRNSYSTSENNSPSAIENSIDTLPSQKRARKTTLSILVPSQRSTLQKSGLNTHLWQSGNLDYSFLEIPHTEIPLKKENSNERSQSKLSESPISKKGKDPTNIDTLPIDGLFDKASQSIYTRSLSPDALLPDATDLSTPSAFKTSTEACFVETRNKKSTCDDYFLKKDQDASMNRISSLDSLPSQCIDPKLRNSKNFLRLSHSPNEGASSKNKIPEMEYSHIQYVGSRGLRKLSKIESREDDQNHIHILSNSPAYEKNTSFSKNYPTTPKSISSFHNPSPLLPTHSYLSPSRRAKMLNIIDSDEAIMSSHFYTSPLSSICREEDNDILELSAGWRKDAIFTTHNGNSYS